MTHTSDTGDPLRRFVLLFLVLSLVQGSIDGLTAQTGLSAFFMNFISPRERGCTLSGKLFTSQAMALPDLSVHLTNARKPAELAEETAARTTSFARNRRMKSLSIDEVAKEVGVSRRTIQSYEAGNRKPSSKIVQLLGSLLGIKADDLHPITASPRGGHLQNLVVQQYMRAFGSRLRRIRELRKASRLKMASDLGLMPDNIRIAEIGRKGFVLSNCYRIAKYLQMSLGELLDSDRPIPVEPYRSLTFPEPVQLAEYLRNLANQRGIRPAEWGRLSGMRSDSLVRSLKGLENGKDIDLLTLFQIANGLGISMYQLFSMEAPLASAMERDQIITLSREIKALAGKPANRRGLKGRLTEAERKRLELLVLIGALPEPGQGDCVYLLDGPDRAFFEKIRGIGIDVRPGPDFVPLLDNKFQQIGAEPLDRKAIQRNYMGTLHVDFENTEDLLGVLGNYSDHSAKHFFLKGGLQFFEDDLMARGVRDPSETWLRYRRALERFVSALPVDGTMVLIEGGEEGDLDELFSNLGWKDVLPELLEPEAYENLQILGQYMEGFDVIKEWQYALGGRTHVFKKMNPLPPDAMGVQLFSDPPPMSRPAQQHNPDRDRAPEILPRRSS